MALPCFSAVIHADDFPFLQVFHKLQRDLHGDSPVLVVMTQSALQFLQHLCMLSDAVACTCFVQPYYRPRACTFSHFWPLTMSQ